MYIEQPKKTTTKVLVLCLFIILRILYEYLANQPFLLRLLYLRLVRAQDVQFLYTRSHLSALQNCALILSTNV